MNQIPWYSDASLVGPNRVFAIGSLAQCVRKWSRLAEIEQIGAHVKLATAFEGRTNLDREDIATLAAHPELKRV
jgi:hypothetical protein